jgi:hypothetical protein
MPRTHSRNAPAADLVSLPAASSIDTPQAAEQPDQVPAAQPGPPSTPLEVTSSRLWPELLVLDLAVHEARAGLAGLFQSQEPLHQTAYKAGAEAYERDLAAYAEEWQCIASEIDKLRAVFERHALPIGSLSFLRELCELAFDLLAIREEWENARAKEPWRDWLHNRQVVGPLLIRMPAPPAVNLDCTKLVTCLFDVVYELSASNDRRTIPAAKQSVSEAMAAVDQIIDWCDNMVSREPGAGGDQSGDKPPAKPFQEAPTITPIERPDRIAVAVALLASHLDWTNKRIAAAAGIHPGSLSRNPIFKQARKVLKCSNAATLPRGRKSRETGEIEAWEDD